MKLQMSNAPYLRPPRLAPSLRNLCACPHLAETVAQWFKAEWGEWPQHQSIENSVARLRGRLNTDKAPLTLLAFDEDRAIGTASLILREMTTHPELQYWLGDLYVVPEYRSRGVGGALMNAVLDHAKNFGADYLYLYTADQMALYASKGWQTVIKEPYEKHAVEVMRRALK